MTPATQGPRALADLSAGLIHASVEISAPRERVFRAISSPEVAEWWGSPETYRVTKWTGEIRAGGWWKSEGVGADGTPFSVGGEVLEVDPPRLLVQTWRYAHAPEETTTLTYRLETIPDGTRLTIRHEGFRDASACEGHSRGWERVLGWLVRWTSTRH